MKVLLVVHGLPPKAAGGTEVYVGDLARALVARGEAVTILARESDPDRPERAVRRETREGVEIVAVNRTFRDVADYEGVYRDGPIRNLAGRLLDRLRPDVVHVHHLTGLTVDLLAEVAARGIPSLVTLHDFWLICQRGQLFDLDGRRCEGPHRGCARCADATAAAGPLAAVAPLARRLPAPLLRLARTVAGRVGEPGPESATTLRDRRTRRVRRALATASAFEAPSRTVRDVFVGFGVAPERIAVRPLGIHVSLFSGAPSAGATRQPGDRLRLGFLGSLMLSKAPHLLLEAAAGLPGAVTVDLWGDVVPYHGDDGYRARLASLLAAPGVRHHGAIPRAEVPRALAGTDALVVPSVWRENCPLVVREAFAAGVPVVTADLGGMAESVRDGVDGLLFRPGDADDLRRVLRRFLDEPDLLPRLRAGIRPPKSIAEDATELAALYRVLPPPPAPPRPRLVAVVVHHRTPGETELAVRSLLSSRRPVDRVVVVDNGSDDDGATRAAAGRDRVEVVATGVNRGFAAGANAGIRRALELGAERVFLLNSDAMVDADAIGRLEEALDDDPARGLAGPVLVAAEDPGRCLGRGIRFSRWTGRMRHVGEGGLYDSERPLPTTDATAVSGAALLVDARVFAAAGLFDERFFLGFEDLELGLRARRHGFASVVVGEAVVYHLGARSPGAARLRHAVHGHLLAARLGAPLPAPLEALRAAAIVGWNVAFALRRGGGRRAALCAVAAGCVDALRGLRRHVKQAKSAGSSQSSTPLH